MTLVRTSLERLLEAVLIVLMTTLAALVLAAIILRAMRSPLTWYDEVAGVLLAWITFYGAALAALKRAHLGFPNLVAALPPALRVPVTIATSALVIGFLLVVAWFSWRVVVLLQGDYLTSLRWVPISFTQSVLPIGAALFVIAELLVLPDRLREAAAGAPARSEHVPDERDDAEQARP